MFFTVTHKVSRFEMIRLYLNIEDSLHFCCCCCCLSWHVMGYWPPPSPPATPHSPKTFYFPPLTKNGCFCIFHTSLLPTSTCSYFWSNYNWLDAVIIDFWRSWNNTLRKHVFTIILFDFFMCNGLPFINTMQKTLKISQKNCFNSQDGWEKTSYPGISAEVYRQITKLSRCIISKVSDSKNTLYTDFMQF